ncbi:nebulin-related-anchoring protein isoform X3 [Gadus macrocephalus]|uniref:nebulin-related-anchoring protein isoform X3 n=1 Tax=Gadus macrocephalus TaxID=80720 RepID=UPI0028CB99D1|nr:nebulin-related-anchoring protein isoform X3 [Gadus macrocephalus]
MQSCARCGFVVYPAEKINCIDQNWHKACFHCDVCRMVLTANNFVSHQKRPYCSVHNPRNNSFTSVYQTPVNINAKIQSKASSELKYREDGDRFMSTFHYDMKSLALEKARLANQMASQTQAYTSHSGFTSEQQTWYSGTVMNQDMVSVSQKTISDVNYVEDFNESKGKGSFPALITPGYQTAKNANMLASNVEYKKGHEERVSKYTTFADPPEVLLAKTQSQIASNYAYTEEYGHQRGKGSFPAHITPGYMVSKKATEMASGVKYRQMYDQEMKGTASAEAGASEALQAKENAGVSQIAYTEQYEQQRGKGSFPAMITPGYKLAKQAQAHASDLKYRKDQKKMKGTSHFTSLTSEDNLALKNARKISKLVSENEYKKDLEHSKGHSINFCDTPQFKNHAKVANFTSDNKYKENYRQSMKGHYEDSGVDQKTAHAMKVRSLASNISYKQGYENEKTEHGEYSYPATQTPGYQSQKKLDPLKEKNYRQHIDQVKYSTVTDTPEIVQARKNAQLVSNLNYKANYEKTKHQYTLHQDLPEIRNAKANAALCSDIKYKEEWEKSKSKACDIGVDTLTFKAAKQSRDLASDIKYKESFRKNKDTAVCANVSDSKTLHSLHVAKMNNDIEYRKGSKENQGQFSLSSDMMNMSHAKKAQALASDLDYRKRLHDYTVNADDIKVQQAKKAYNLQSENKYRQDVSSLRYTSVKDTPEMVQAKASNILSVDRLYRQKAESLKHNYTLSGELPEHIQAKINAQNISESKYKESWNKVRDGGYKLRLDAISFQSAKASGDILSDQKYKEQFEKTKGKMIGLKGLEDDLNLSHSVQSGKLQSDIKYKQKSTKGLSQYHLSMDMLEVAHAKKAQALASDQDYRLTLHNYTSLADDVQTQAARKAYALHSDKVYRADLNYLRGAAWIATGALGIEGSKKASELISDRKYRQQPYHFKHTSVADSPDILHAKLSGQVANERLYKVQGANNRHNYTLTAERPEITQAKINAANFSDIKYKESWHTLRAQGYRLTMQDIPFQAAKTSTGIASDIQYKHNHVLDKGKHIGAKSVTDDPYLVHCLQAGRLASNQEYGKEARTDSGKFHLNQDMMGLVTARNAQALASDQDYKTRLHDYTVLPDDMKVQWAKKAYDLQSQNQYKSDLSFMKGVAWDGVGAPQMESAKKAGDLLSEKKYRQPSDRLKFTSVTDSPDMVHAKNSYQQCSERLYKSGKNDDMHKYTLHGDDPDFLRAKLNAQQISNKAYKASADQGMSVGYDLRLDAIPFQTAKASTAIASDLSYKESHLREKGQQVGLLSVADDPKMVHSLAASKLQSNLEYKRQSKEERGRFKMGADQPEFQQAKKSQAQASDLTYRQRLHDYTCDPQQLNLQHAKQAYKLQSDVNYKADLNWSRGVGWTPPGCHKAELARRAAELGLAEGVTTDEAIAQYQQLMMIHHQRRMMEQEEQQQQQQSSELVETSEEIHDGVNMDAMEILHVKKNKALQKKSSSSSSTTTSSSSTSFRSMQKKGTSSSSKQSAIITSSSSSSSSSAAATAAFENMLQEATMAGKPPAIEEA